MREEMNRAGAIELADAGDPAGRAVAGDRAAGRSTGPSCCASRTATSATSSCGPTHEEVITDIARKEIRSYRQLPVNFYQIQTKFRDEIRPRFGVMRAREFMMKDAYSFDADKAALMRRYQRDVRRLRAHLHAAGPRSSARSQADTGAIGGIASHEFQVLADSGEDAIAYCAGVRLRGERRAGGSAGARRDARPAPAEAMQKVPTPGQSTCEEVARAARTAARAHGQVPDGVRAGQACRCCSCAAITRSTR